jgi:hypothetical protein
MIALDQIAASGEQGLPEAHMDCNPDAYIEAKVNGIPHEILADPGAAVSCCSLKTYLEMKRRKLIQ